MKSKYAFSLPVISTPKQKIVSGQKKNLRSILKNNDKQLPSKNSNAESEKSDDNFSGMAKIEPVVVVESAEELPERG